MPAALQWRRWRLIQSQLIRSSSLWSRRGLQSGCQVFSPIRSSQWLLRRGYRATSSTRVGENRDAEEQNNADYVTREVRDRRAELDSSKIDQYPRYRIPHCEKLTTGEFLRRVETTAVQESEDAASVSEVLGRITSIRLSGNKLAFIDISENFHTLQVVLQYNSLDHSSVTLQAFKNHCRLMRRGDFISVRGSPYITDSGQPSIKALALPEIVSPCLQSLPTERYGESSTPEVLDARSMDKFVEYVTDPSSRKFFISRSEVLRAMRFHFHKDDFVEVETPILSANAGGASARPFETTATEFSDRKLFLRIAPELWLKRLIIGGMTRIYEIGPCFRNEGLDKTHNPEFTTCEFYAVREDLSSLKIRTEKMLQEIAATVPIHADNLFSNRKAMTDFFTGPYKEIDFIPALNGALQLTLPNLASETATDELLHIFRTKSIPLPSKISLPRLLDKLSSTYLEPQCQNPTWISHLPECLSPLSKSFIHPTAPNDQPVAARAELFVKCSEIVNCYEEENDPFKQRRKFMDQQRYARDPKSGGILDEEMMKVDEDYIRALEWGLPPTGGWGCGIDRLVMLFTGKEKIGDVLSFGNLRAVTRSAERWEGPSQK